MAPPQVSRLCRLAGHHAIYSAVLAGDADLARSRAMVHIAGVESWLRTTLTD